LQRTNKRSRPSKRNDQSRLGLINGKKQRLDKTRNRARYSAVKYKAVLSVLKDIRNLAAKMKKLIAKSPQGEPSLHYCC
jgi:predicted transcriptional regulator